ncbi:MAG: AAA family ATPase, partial [Gemmatirosa sp.]|nr:AAA family ATPase [Gemmatirosa sp.]
MSTESPIAAVELPVHLTRFVGRDRELEDLDRLVGSVRLLTLTGAGGSGKTRLAREAASHTAAAFQRVCWVDLAPLADPALVAQQVATALHVPERSGVTPLALLADALRAERVLLVLDNCEHLVDACATLAEALLRVCPNLTVLTTSREALGVASETAWLVPPLASAEAVQLFVERARAALPTFERTAANAASIAEICRRLDGIPLAIELAAARARVLTPEQIATRLDDAFRLLTVGNRTALPRHRTLRATMEWSFGLLGTREQVLLRRLAVFAGSFSLDAAESIAVGDPLDADDILDGVAALVDRSLVLMEPGDGEARYRLLETVRQYGVERLTEAGELDALRRRHAEHFLAVIETAAPDIVGGPNAPGIIEPLVAELDNLRAATAWAVADPSRTELGLRFAGAMSWLWYVLGQFREARQLVDRALALQVAADAPADPLLRGRALVSSALTAFMQGDYPRSCADFAAGVPLLRVVNDASVGGALAKYGAARLFAGDVDGAVVTLDEAVALTDAAPARDMGQIFARFWRGWAAYVQGDLALAHALIAAVTHVGRVHAHPTTLSHGLVTLGRIELARGHVEEACAAAAEGLEREVANGDAWGSALAIDVVALAAERRGNAVDAARLLGGVDAHRERLAVALPGLASAERDALLAALRNTLGTRFDAVYAEGRHMSTAETVAAALAEATRHTTEHRVVPEALAVLHQPRVEPAQVQRLRVNALGPLQVFVGDRPVESAAWGSARPRELLVYLLMHPEGRTKEQVGLAFWPDASAAQLRNSFHVTLHRLRKALGGADWVGLVHDR